MNALKIRYVPAVAVALLLLLAGCTGSGGAPGSEDTATETGPQTSTESVDGGQNIVVTITSPADQLHYNRPDPEFSYTVTQGADNQPVPVERLQASVNDVVEGEWQNRRAISDMAATNLPAVPNGLHDLEFVVNDENGAPQVTVVVRYSTDALPIASAGADQSVHAGDPVVLEGGDSYSPVGDPITYSWEILSAPEGSLAELNNGTGVSPSFVADQAGEYVVQLVVRDASGTESEPDTVRVSTENTAPIADSSGNQVVSTIGDVVEVDGGLSFDADGDDLTFHWEITTRPEGSNAEVSDPTSPVAIFGVDVQGTYELTLIVFDAFGEPSAPHLVTVTFYNVAPVALAETGQSSVYVGDPVYLDGSGSYDDNLDPILFAWNKVSQPEGSGAVLASLDTPETSFVPDLAGTYVNSLVVSDGKTASNPANLSVVALSQVQSGAVEALFSLLEEINGLENEDFRNPNNRKALTNKVLAALEDLDNGRYWNAWKQLGKDVLRKTNGCAYRGHPDKQDWIVNCDAQDRAYALVKDAMAAIVGTVELKSTAIEILNNALAVINSLDGQAFYGHQARAALTGKINYVLEKVEQGDYWKAWRALRWHVLLRTNGCAWRGEPDRWDLVRSCEAQEQLYPLLHDAIAALVVTAGEREWRNRHDDDDGDRNERDDGDWRNDHHEGDWWWPWRRS